MKITLKQIRKAVIVLFFIVLSGIVGFRFGQSKISVSSSKEKSPSREEVDLSLFWQVWDKLEEKHLDRKNFNYEKMVFGAISGLASSLDDPYTVFLPPTENNESKDELRGDFEGVGIQIGFNKSKQLSIIAPLEGTPAKAAGLKSGDVIIRIVDEAQNINKDTIDITLPEAVKLIKGKKGSTVTLSIFREGNDKVFDVSLKRDTIVVKSVEVSFAENNDKKVAVLKLSRFGERTDQEWAEAIQKVLSTKSEIRNFGGVILDLRNNPGGFLQGSVFIASEFLDSGVIVQQDSGVNGKEIFQANRKGLLLTDPLVVLINGGSASASEIVAGALQEAKRAKLVGENTFGKGTVQEAEDLPGGAGLHVTVSRWLLPSGKSIDKEGVKPDVEVKISEEDDDTKDLQLEKAIAILTK